MNPLAPMIKIFIKSALGRRYVSLLGSVKSSILKVLLDNFQGLSAFASIGQLKVARLHLSPLGTRI